MYLIVVGLGGIGRALAGLAAEEGHSVVVIDRDEEKCANILEEYDLLAVSGNATDKNTLEDAGIDRADALVATTSDDAYGVSGFSQYQVVAMLTNISEIIGECSSVEVFTLSGIKVTEGEKSVLGTLAPGIYLVKNGNAAVKVVVE